MSKTVEVTVRVHNSVPGCCRSTLLAFAARDVYGGAGEPGDQVGCPCGNTLVYGPPGWNVLARGVSTETRKDTDEDLGSPDGSVVKHGASTEGEHGE